MQPSFLFHEGITLYATIFFIKMKTQREFNFYFDSYDDIFELKPMVAIIFFILFAFFQCDPFCHYINIWVTFGNINRYNVWLILYLASITGHTEFLVKP